MDKEKIDRINYLSKKAREKGLTPKEAEERALLREEYLLSVRINMRNVLENTYIQDEKGNKMKLKRKRFQ